MAKRARRCRTAAAAARCAEQGLHTAAAQGSAQAGPRVYVWGRRWAIPVSEASGDPVPEGDVRAPVEVSWFREHAERHRRGWSQVAFGPTFGAARTDAGELFVWGSWEKGRAGEKHTVFVEPRAVAYDGGAGAAGCERACFCDVQCSESAVWALTSAGEVVVWEQVPNMLKEFASLRPSDPRSVGGGRRVDSLTRPITKMSVGATHAAFITDEGELVCLGSNKHGECGLDPNVQATAATCRRVAFPRRAHPIEQARCGRSHTVAIAAEGDGFAWGDDSKIQLALGDTRSNFGDERHRQGSRGYLNMLRGGEGMALSPALRGGPDATLGREARSGVKYGEYEPHYQFKPLPMMPIPLEFHRQQHGTPYPPPDVIECGDDFTILVVRDSPDFFPAEESTNRLFCCGENSRGQCGRNMQSSQQTLAATRLPINTRVEVLSCGSSHCLAVLKRIGPSCSSKREVWGWGSNEHGQAGGGTPGMVCPAARLRAGIAHRVEAVWCGFSNSAAICSDRPETVRSKTKGVSVRYAE